MTDPDSELPRHLDRMHEQACLQRWFPEDLTDGEQQVSFGNTELAVIGETLERIESHDSLLISNPVPSDRLVLGILAAYTRTQDPRFPTSGMVGRGRSALAFPALHKGYVSTLDDIRVDILGQATTAIERESVNQLSDVEGAADLFTANNNFEFDGRRPPAEVGMVFVDLRKPEWGEPARRFGDILAFREEIHRPMIFYTDDLESVELSLREQMPVRKITNESMVSVGSSSQLTNSSQITQFECLVDTDDLAVDLIHVGSADLERIIPDLTAMRDDIQQNQGMGGVVSMEVGWVYNLLTKLPVKPEYWDRAVESNFYQQGVRELLENLRGKAQRMDGRTGDVLINFCQAANELQGRLNDTHPLQDALMQLITADAEIDTQRTVIVNNDFEREAILQAATLEDHRLADEVVFRTLDEVAPSTEGEYIVARPMGTESHIYDFPVGTQIAFLQFDLWDSAIEDRLADGLGAIGATIETTHIGDTEEKDQAHYRSHPSAGAATDYDPVEDADMSDVSETLQEDFQSGDEGGTTGAGGGSRSGGAGTPDLAVTLSNGETRELSRHARVSVLKETGDIGRKQAKSLNVGDTMVLLDTVADDIYDLFIESAHQKDQIRKSESVVERWRTILDEAIENEWMEINLLTEIQEHGSNISDQSVISNWRTGETIGPQDPEDVRRVLEVLKPEMTPATEATVEAMKHIRQKHRDIGRQAQQAIENQIGGGMAQQVTTDVPDTVDVSADDVRKATIESITTLDE